MLQVRGIAIDALGPVYRKLGRYLSEIVGMRF